MCEQLICGQNGKHFLLIKSLYFFCACLASSSNSAGLALYVSVRVCVCLTLVLKARVCAHLCRTASMIIRSFLFLFLYVHLSLGWLLITQKSWCFVIRDLVIIEKS